MEAKEKAQIIAKIKILVQKAEQIRGKEFRLALEDLVNQGGEEAEYILVHYLTDKTLPFETRMEIIRVAGYLLRSSFLVPLKRIIDTEQHARIQQGAILSVAKFNDRRALNILNQALQKMNNPLLMSTLNAEISRIKENNPILALLPRFKEGKKSPKTFNVTLQILKRILSPADAGIFTKFLNSEDALVQNGAFEILCMVGDIFYDEDILGFYETRFNACSCTEETECDELYFLTLHLKQYISRYQFLIEEQVPVLKERYFKVNDLRVKQLVFSIISRSKEKEAVSFMEQVFPDEPQLQTVIVEEMSGNELAADFLFQLYRENEDLKKKAMQSLLNMKKGLDYFIKHFFSLAFEEQEIIALNLPYAGQHDLVMFIRKIFQTGTYRLKEILLSKVKETYEFAVKELLFAPEHEREFYFMGDEYLTTITKLFPVSAVKRLLEKIVYEDISVVKTKKYLTKIYEVAPMELILNFRDKEFIGTLITKILKANNAELNVLLLAILKNVKTLEPAVHAVIRESIGLFISRRETNITPKEKGELRRCRRNLSELVHTIGKVQEGISAMKRLFKQDPVDFDTLGNVVKHYHLAVVLYKKHFFTYLAQQVEKVNSTNIDAWTEFLLQYPGIAGQLKERLSPRIEGQTDLAYKPLQELTETLSDQPPRIMLNFTDRHLTAVLREQLEESAPDITVVIDGGEFHETDLLLCDPEVLRDFTLQSKPLPSKVYLFMENLAGFAELKALNTKNFVQPFLFFRIVKEILQEFYC